MKFLSKSRSGFTLIELLVVIGIIAVLAGGVGLAIRDNNPASALRAGQGLLVSTLSAARGQAALAQSNTKIIVRADQTNENFLRQIRVVVFDAAANSWKQVGGDVILPAGIYVVPSGTVSGFTFAGSGRRSTFFESTAPAIVTGISDGTWISSNIISPLGFVSTFGNIVVGSGSTTSSGVTLNNYESLQGLSVSRYGIASIINEAASFGP